MGWDQCTSAMLHCTVQHCITAVTRPHLFHVILQMKIWILWPLEGGHKFNPLGFFWLFYQKKKRKNYDNIAYNFQQKISIQKLIFIYFYTKIIILPRKVRHVSPSRDVCLSLTTKYLHIDISNQILMKVWIFCVLLLYELHSCEVFPPV